MDHKLVIFKISSKGEPEMQYCAIGLGEVLWDLLPGGKQLGGAPANFAYHINALGGGKVSSYVVSSVGKDYLGDEILMKLRDLSVNVVGIFVDSKNETGVVDVEIDQNGIPSYRIKEKVAWDFIPNNSENLAPSSSVVCFGSLAQRYPVSKNSIQSFITKTPEDSLRIFDINLRQHYYSKEVINDSLEASNVLKINDEELVKVAGLFDWPGSEEDVLKRIVANYNLKLGVLTKGEEGSILLNEEGVSSHRGYPTKVKDSVGAGDSFTAAVALGLLRDMDLESINDYANRVASFVCSQEGATPILSRELAEMYNK